MPRRIAIVEDNDQDFQVILRALDRVNADVSITRFIDGGEALETLRDMSLEGDAARMPEVIMLDLSLPGVDGRTFLAEVKTDETLRMIPVVVLSSSNSESEVAETYRLGASGFVVKPIDRPKFEQMIANVHEYWLRSVILPDRAYLS